jgi:hypothetical protein
MVSDASGAVSSGMTDFHMELLKIRGEVLIPLTARWPQSERELAEWDRVAETAKKDYTNPMAAALKLHVKFSPCFWAITLGNLLFNLKTCPLEYLQQQAMFFHMDPKGWPEEEAAIMCRIAVALKRITERESNKVFQVFNVEDCRDFLALAKALPVSENARIVELLTFVVKHSILQRAFMLSRSDLAFWEEVTDLLDQTVRSSGDASQKSPLAVAAREKLSFLVTVGTSK